MATSGKEEKIISVDMQNHNHKAIENRPIGLRMVNKIIQNRGEKKMENSYTHGIKKQNKREDTDAQ